MVMVAQGHAISRAARPAKQASARMRCWRCNFMYLIEGVGSRLTIRTEVMAMTTPEIQGWRTEGSFHWKETSSGSSIMQAAAGVGRPVK